MNTLTSELNRLNTALTPEDTSLVLHPDSRTSRRRLRVGAAVATTVLALTACSGKSYDSTNFDSAPHDAVLQLPPQTMVVVEEMDGREIEVEACEPGSRPNKHPDTVAPNCAHVNIATKELVKATGIRVLAINQELHLRSVAEVSVDQD